MNAAVSKPNADKSGVNDLIIAQQMLEIIFSALHKWFIL